MMESHYSNAIKIKFELVVRNKSFFKFQIMLFLVHITV